MREIEFAAVVKLVIDVVDYWLRRARQRQALEIERAKFKPKFDALDADLPDEPKKKAGGSWWDALSRFSFSSKPAGPAATRQEEKLRKLTADYQSKQAEIV